MLKLKSLCLAPLLCLAFVSSGCVSHVRAEHHAQFEAEPTLVHLSPGLWVIEDYHEPVFYCDDHYWAYRNGLWYRSSIYSGAWVRVHTVPVRLHGVRQPHRYSYYHAPKRYRRRPVIVRHHNSHTRTHRAPRRAPADVRDHRRKPQARPAVRTPRNPPVVVRDKRTTTRTVRTVEVRDQRKAKPAKSKTKVKVRDHRRK